MPADSKVQMFPLGVGMDQSLDEFSVPFGNIRRAINTRVRKGGSVELRHGVHGFSLGVPSAVGFHQLNPTGVIEWVSKIGNAPVLGVRGKTFAFSRAKQEVSYCGAFSEYLPISKSNAFLDEKQEGGYNSSRNVAVAYDSAGNEYTILATIGDQGVRRQITILNSNGAVVSSMIGINAAQDLRIVSSPDHPVVWVLFLHSTNVIRGDRIDLDKGPQIIESLGNFATLDSNARGWAACRVPLAEDPDGDQLLVVYQSSDSEITLSAFNWNAGSLVDSNTGNMTSSASSSAMTVVSDSHFIAIGILRDPATVGAPECHVYSVATLSVSAVLQLASPEANAYSVPILSPWIESDVSSDSKFRWAIGHAPGTGDTRTEFGAITSSGTVTFGALVSGTLPMSEFDNWGNIWLLWSGEQGYLYSSEAPRHGRIGLCRFPNDGPTGGVIEEPLKRTSLQLSTERFGPEPLDSEFMWRPGQSRFSTIGHGRDRLVVLLPALLRTQDTKLFGLELYAYQHATQHPFRDTIATDRGVVVAGQPYEVSITGWRPETSNSVGRNASAELGFFEEPHITLATGIATGANPPGTRGWRAVYEWISPNGDRHRSRPSPPLQQTSTVNGLVGFNVLPATVTSKRFYSRTFGSIAHRAYSATVVHFYRQVNGGTSYHRVTPDDGAPQAAHVATGARVTFIDPKTDDDIRDNEILYTDGGVQPNDLAPSCRFLAIGEERLWLGGLFDPEIIQCSKAFAPREPIQFSDHDAFKVRLPFACTGLAYLDGSVVAFCSDSIYTVSGAGPDNRGFGGYTLRPISGDVGCIDYRSIVETAEGVFFQSSRGIQLLPRGFGAPTLFRNLNDLMGEFGDGFTEVIGATNSYASDEETVRFLLRNPTTNERIVAVLEMSTKTWSYDIIRDGDGNKVPLSCIGDGPEGVLYGAGSGTLKLFSEISGRAGTPYDSMGSQINRFLGELHMNKAAPFGDAGVGRLIAVQMRGFSPGGGQMNTSIITDRAIQSHTYSGIGSGTFYKRYTMREPTTTEVQVSATFGTVSGDARGMRLISLTLELEPIPGARRANDGEQE